jgi:hypothetical protein
MNLVLSSFGEANKVVSVLVIRISLKFLFTSGTCRLRLEELPLKSTLRWLPFRFKGESLGVLAYSIERRRECVVVVDGLEGCVVLILLMYF